MSQYPHRSRRCSQPPGRGTRRQHRSCHRKRRRCEAAQRAKTDMTTHHRSWIPRVRHCDMRSLFASFVVPRIVAQSSWKAAAPSMHGRSMPWQQSAPVRRTRGSRRHRAAGCLADPARRRACLTVLHRVRTALLRAEFATVGAEGTELRGKRTVPRHGVGAEATECRAIDAAGRTCVGALLPRHLGKAVAARDRAVVAGGHASEFASRVMIEHQELRKRTCEMKESARRGAPDERPFNSHESARHRQRSIESLTSAFVARTCRTRGANCVDFGTSQRCAAYRVEVSGAGCRSWMRGVARGAGTAPRACAHAAREPCAHPLSSSRPAVRVHFRRLPDRRHRHIARTT